MSVELGVQLEATCALEDAKEFIDERGIDIIIKPNLETNVGRDLYGSIKKRTPTNITVHGFPVTFSPSSEQLRKAGIKEDVDVMITLATLDFVNNSLTYDSIDHTRWEVEIDGHLYSIKDRNQINQFGHVYLNITMGLVTK